jgi:transposase-like protein
VGTGAGEGEEEKEEKEEIRNGDRGGYRWKKRNKLREAGRVKLVVPRMKSNPREAEYIYTT